jgi:hypothetical protein
MVSRDGKLGIGCEYTVSLAWHDQSVIAVFLLLCRFCQTSYDKGEGSFQQYAIAGAEMLATVSNSSCFKFGREFELFVLGFRFHQTFPTTRHPPYL